MGMILFPFAGPGQQMTHLFLTPTAHTLRVGEWQIGIGPIAFGITNDLMLGTNILGDILTIFNIQAKFRVLNTSSFALSAIANFVSAGMLWGVDLPNAGLSFGPVMSWTIAPKSCVHAGLYLSAFGLGGLRGIGFGSLFGGADFALTQDLAGLVEFVTGDTGVGVGGGVEWRLGTFRLKGGVIAAIGEQVGAIPWVDLYWRF